MSLSARLEKQVDNFEELTARAEERKKEAEAKYSLKGKENLLIRKIGFNFDRTHVRVRNPEILRLAARIAT